MSGRHADWPARLRLDPSAFVAPGAVVVGAVELGARSSVWFNTVVRGDSAEIRIGEDTNVQDNSTVHVDEGFPALVGRRVTVGHRAIVHGCVIEDDCLIGMGAVILTGARVGTGSLIGAASLVREHQVIPPGSLVLGAPAKVIGPVADAHREAIRTGAEHYVELSRAYLAKGFARPHPGPRSATGISAFAPGPMTREEWGRCLDALAHSPGWAAQRLEEAGAARASARPSPERWSAHEVVGHLRDCDLDVFAPRLQRVLAQSMPFEPEVDVSGGGRVAAWAAAPVSELLGAWRTARAALVAGLAPLTPAEWGRVSVHAVRGPSPLADQVRGWVEHDLSHRRQIALALGVSP